MYKILRREIFSDVTFLWEVEAPDIAASAAASNAASITSGCAEQTEVMPRGVPQARAAAREARG